MIKYGFELEGFLLKDRKPHLVPLGLPSDECGWLVEIRGEPHFRPDLAMALMLTERDLITRRAEKLGYTILWEPLLEIPRELKVEAARKTGKGILRYQNFYGFETHRNSTKLATASMHISITNQQTFFYRDKDGTEKSFGYQGVLDHAKLIGVMDRAFALEIRKAKRNPGFYEIKDDGRIEYRSLPNNVEPSKVVETLVGAFNPPSMH